jgi:hypothetical protein
MPTFLLCIAFCLDLYAAEKQVKAPVLPRITAPILFNTPESDQLMSRIQLVPPNSAWREDVSKRPVLPESQAMIAGIGPEAALGCNLDMGFVIVPPKQAVVAVRITEFPDESDPGPYPVPDNAPIEGWGMDNTPLERVQREGDGDRHVIVLDPFAGKLYEFFGGRRSSSGWEAGCAAVFNLTSNTLRPSGWTSADAAGLPILPAVVRYDECARGVIDHALRFTVRRTRKACIYPATHFASRSTDQLLPAMGQRFRLKAAVKTDHFPKHARAIAEALKKYGMLVADNGSNWRISVAPDPRICGLDALHAITGSDFEVIQTTGEREGPRAHDGRRQH